MTPPPTPPHNNPAGRQHYYFFGGGGGGGSICNCECFKVARYSFSGSITPKCERELRRHLQRFGELNSTVVLDKDETLL